MQFTKIKYDGKKVELSWTTKTEHEKIEHHITSDESPDVDLVTALRRFVPHVVDLLHVPEQWGRDLRVTGLSLTEEEDGAEGVVITARTPLPATKAPFQFNLPYLKENPEGKELPGFFRDGMGDDLSAARAAAERFVKGERAQQKLALEG